ncbi:MAG: GNAT family N-acetyltransferase [Acidobacteriota bacterium]
MDARRGAFTISTDPARLDRAAIHEFLAGSYWAEGISREIVDRSIEGSLNFGLYDGARQAGFARVVTDRSTFAYVCDVFVLPSHQGRGLARWLMEVVRAHPDLQGLRRWMLLTRDAHPLYLTAGFSRVEDPARYMEIVDREIYSRPRASSEGTMP